MDPINSEETKTSSTMARANAVVDRVGQLKQIIASFTDSKADKSYVDIKLKRIDSELLKMASHSNMTAIMVLRWWADSILSLAESDSIYRAVRDEYRDAWSEETTPCLYGSTWQIHNWSVFWPIGYVLFFGAIIGIGLSIAAAVSAQQLTPFIIGSVVTLFGGIAEVIVSNCAKKFVIQELTAYHNIETDCLKRALMAARLVPGAKTYDSGIFDELDSRIFQNRIRGLYRPYAVEFLNRIVIWLCRNPTMTISDVSEHFSDQLRDLENLTKLCYSERK